MATTQTSQIWQPQQLNNSGIRRLKIVDSRSVTLLPVGVNTNKVSLLPTGAVELFEFIFPSDLSCVATTALLRKESGYPYWTQNVSFTLPHLQNEVLNWAGSNAEAQWLLIAEDYNEITRLMGGSRHGLDMSFQASTGAMPNAENPMAFTFTGEQLQPYQELPGYDDSMIFPVTPGFTYGFSLAFEA